MRKRKGRRKGERRRANKEGNKGEGQKLKEIKKNERN